MAQSLGYRLKATFSYRQRNPPPIDSTDRCIASDAYRDARMDRHIRLTADLQVRKVADGEGTAFSSRPKVQPCSLPEHPSQSLLAHANWREQTHARAPSRTIVIVSRRSGLRNRAKPTFPKLFKLCKRRLLAPRRVNSPLARRCFALRKGATLRRPRKHRSSRSPSKQT